MSAGQGPDAETVTMTTTMTIDPLTRLRRAKRNPPLDGVNPHFRSKYSTLHAVLETVDATCGEAQLEISQGVGDGCLVTTLYDLGLGGRDVLETVAIPLPDQPDPQKLAAWLTYMRRISYCIALGVTGEEDDDGNRAAAPAKPAASRQNGSLSPGKAPQSRPDGQADVQARMKAAARQATAGRVDGDRVTEWGVGDHISEARGRRFLGISGTAAKEAGLSRDLCDQIRRDAAREVAGVEHLDQVSWRVYDELCSRVVEMIKAEAGAGEEPPPIGEEEF